MGRILDAEHMVPALAAMVGCCEVDDGPTVEQRALIGALASGYFHVPVDLDSLAPLGPHEASAAFESAAQRRRVQQLLMFAELCRHPLTATQVARTDEYAKALDADNESMAIARDLVNDGVARAEADFYRMFVEHEPNLREPSLAGAPASAPTTIDPELAARLQALHQCAEGTLGRAYVDFYDRWGFALPGTEEAPAAVFVAHDMSHVISGYEPRGVGEIALGAMQIGMDDTDDHWVQFLGNLGVHEAGYLQKGASLAVLSEPGAVDTVAHALERGVSCAADFTLVDHLSMVDEPLESVRATFGVPPRMC